MRRFWPCHSEVKTKDFPHHSTLKIGVGLDCPYAQSICNSNCFFLQRFLAIRYPGFNPFATMFSRKSGTRVQERAEERLAKLAERQDRLQQRFSGIEDRNVTILLPRLTSHALTNEPEPITIKDCDRETTKQRTLALVAQLWRERISRIETRRFETRAVREMRVLRASKVYPYVLVRVRLPSGIHIQARFNSRETMEVWVCV